MLREHTRMFAAVALALACSCAREAPPAPAQEVATDAPTWVEAPESAGALLAPAWFERAPDGLGLDFLHVGDAEGQTLTGQNIVLFDANNDTRLDLYFTNGATSGDEGATPERMGRLYMMEQERFVDRTADAGLALDSLAGRALAAQAVDYDGDGDWDLLLSYPGHGRLMRNEGGRFTDVSGEADSARSALDSLDTAADDRPGTNRPPPDLAPVPGAPPSFARATFDANLDGHMDLLTLDGALVPTPDNAGPSQRREPRLFLATGVRGEYVDASASSGLVFDSPIAGRSLAFGDLDGDLDVDVVVTEHGGPAQVWLNQNPSGNRPLRLVLLSRAPNTFALGAQVTVTGGTADAARRVHLGSRYLTQNEHTLTFGLGAAQTTDVTVRWPDGRTTEHRDLAPGPTHVLH